MTNVRLYFLAFTIFVLSILVVIGTYYFAGEAPSTLKADILKELAKVFSQLAVIGVLGALVKYVFDRIAEYRKKEEAENNFRRETLGKLITTHSEIRAARDHIEAAKSARTYGDQMRIIIAARLDLDQLSHEIETARYIYEAPQEIKGHISSMESYLKKLVEEYKNKYKKLSEIQGTTPEHIWEELEKLDQFRDFREGSENGEYHKEYLLHYFKVRDHLQKEILAACGVLTVAQTEHEC